MCCHAHAAFLPADLAILFIACLQVIRDKNVLKPAPGTRKCNCRQKVVTHQIGPGMYQQYTTQVRGVGWWGAWECRQ